MSIDDLIAEFLEAVERGETPDRQEFFDRNPEFKAELEEFFASHDELFGAMQSDAAPNQQGEQATLAPSGTDQRSNRGDSITGEHRVIGNYEILEEIDRGGMGIVFRALDRNLDRIVAVKMIRSGRLASDSDVQRFNAEARAAAKLDHPGIVPVHEVGTHEGHPYFSMAFIEGENLDAFHKRKKLSIEEACTLIKDVALAIDHAHENNLIHRDLKPANILMDKKGRPRITDFGLAKSLGSDDGLTGTGEIIGTINYMAPEQAAARNDQVNRPTDIYSLGAMLYFLCTGKPPFETDNPVDTLLRILDSEPTLASKVNAKVPHDVAVICMRCLEKDPKNRYQTARELVADIDRFLKGDPVEASKSNFLSRIRKWSRSEPSLVGHLVGLGLIELTRTFSYLIEIAFFDRTFGEYIQYTIIISVWAAACFLLQKLQNWLAEDEQIIKFVWAATDIAFLTVVLLMAKGSVIHSDDGEVGGRVVWNLGIIGQLDNGDDSRNAVTKESTEALNVGPKGSHAVGSIGPLYIAYPLVIVMSGFFSQVRLVTFTTIMCLISFAIVFVGHSIQSPHFGVVGFAAIIAIGYVMCLLVHRIRLLNRLFE